LNAESQIFAARSGRVASESDLGQRVELHIAAPLSPAGVIIAGPQLDVAAGGALYRPLSCFGPCMYWLEYHRKKQKRTISASVKPKNSGSFLISSSNLASRSSSSMVRLCRAFTALSQGHSALKSGSRRNGRS